MPRYFFHIHDGSEYQDTVGTPLDDDRAARDEAVHLLSQTLITFAKEGFWKGEAWAVLVEDAERRMVARLEVKAQRGT